MKKRENARRHATAARLASLTIANALIFQAELAESDETIDTLQQVLDDPDPRTRLEDHWLYITKTVNYQSIFGLAREVLIALPRRAEVATALRALARHVQAIVVSRSALRHDLMGRIYHRLLLEAKYLGTFYTSVPSATLLMRLALNPPSWNVDWSSIAEISALRIADLACGTGTLLMAADQAIVDNYVAESVRVGNTITRRGLSELHKRLIEDVLHGYDVLSSAIHLTASTLALLAVDTSFRQMNLFSMRFGVEADGTVRLGSIDYLNASSLSPQMSLMVSAPSPAMAVSVQGSSETMAPLPELDLCAINPPFTRSAGKNLLFGSLPSAQRASLQAQLAKFLRDYQRRGAWVSWNITAGLGSIFVSIAAGRIKPNGRLALVLPAAVAFGSSWGKTRELLTNLFDVEFVISSHDPDRWSFSESTDLSEVLIIARRRGDATPGRVDTIFVNLWRNVATSIDGIAVGDSLITQASRVVPLLAETTSPRDATTSIIVGTTKRGECFRFALTPGSAQQWYPIAFAQTDLNRTAVGLSTGSFRLAGDSKPHHIELCALEAICAIGPDGRDVYDCFDESKSVTAYRALWGYEAHAMSRLCGVANRYLVPLSAPLRGRPLRKVDHVWPKAGRIMIPDKIRLQTRTAVATLLDEPAVSNVWWPVSLLDETDLRHEKVLVLWLNSSLGITLMMAGRVPTEGAFVKFKKPFLRSLMILDVRKLADAQIAKLVASFDAISGLTLKPLSEIATDDVRAMIDSAFADVLKLPVGGGLRELLAREPILTNVGL